MRHSGGEGPTRRREGTDDPVRALDEGFESPEDQALRAELQALPLEAEPARDLWPGIQGRLAPRNPAGGGGAAGTALSQGRSRRVGGVSLSWGQAAAAGLVLMMASGAAEIGRAHV